MLTPPLRRVARRIWFFPGDLYDIVVGKKQNLVPPKGLIFTGAGDFNAIGNKMLQYFIASCALKPFDKVLDIGCGIGRIARPLTTYLNKEGKYYGFDIVQSGIYWCRQNYKTYTNFDFQYIPLRNDLYNLSANEDPAAFTFPYYNNYFDLVVLISVFTHMQEPDVRRYISEISRVLKPGKFCFCTFFIITKESDEYLKKSKDPFFKFRFEHYFLHDRNVKDANVAFKYEAIEEMLKSSDLKIKAFHPGWWAGKEKKDALDFQDVLIITKGASGLF
jgi:ubiquinone/menaquinone biosynthesis C-methylase UbiE